MSKENIINELRNNIKILTNSERKVADYIIKHTSEATFDTVNGLSKKVGTSTTTIMRLAAKMGYSGYAELQNDLQEYIMNNSAPKERLISNLQNVKENQLWSQTANYYIQQINQLFNQIDQTSLDEVVSIIKSSKNVYCTCVRSGLPVGQYFSQNVNRIHGNCSMIVADLSDWVDEIISMGPDDVLVAISFPRYANRIHEFVKIAKEKNVKIVIITDTYTAPVVEFGDVVILCDSSSLAFHNSPVTATVVVDYIINALAVKNSKDNSKRLEEVSEILKRIDYHA